MTPKAKFMEIDVQFESIRASPTVYVKTIAKIMI